MTLVQGTLESQLSLFMDSSAPGFTTFPVTSQAAAALWAAAYDSYALAATDASGDGLLAASRAGFEAALSFPLTATPVSAAAELAAAFLAYWAGATFAVGQLLSPATEPCPSIGGNGLWSVETTSVVTAASSNPLELELFGILSLPSNSAGSKIEDIASAFHKATTTDVTVLITGLDTTPTPTGPLPITNSCQVS